MHPVTTGDVLLMEIRDLLREVRDRLPEQPSSAPDPAEPVEVRGVDAPATPTAKKTTSKPRTRRKQ